jgi:hypothetical protein
VLNTVEPSVPPNTLIVNDSVRDRNSGPHKSQLRRSSAFSSLIRIVKTYRIFRATLHTSRLKVSMIGSSSSVPGSRC